MVLRFNKLPNGQNSNRHLCSGTWKVDWRQGVGNSALRKVREHISANGAANDGHCRCLSLLFLLVTLREKPFDWPCPYSAQG